MQYRIYILISLLVSISFSNILNAQEEMSLEKAISIGLDNNLGIKIDDQTIQIAENNDTWARAGKTPSIDLSLSFNNTLIEDNNPASFLKGAFYNTSLGATASAQWLVYAGGRVGIVKDQLSLAVQQQMLAKKVNIHSLIRSINQQYYEVIFQQEQNEVLKNNLILSKDRLLYEETKRSFGASNSYNLIQFENAVMTDSINISRQLNGIEIAKRNLYNTLDIAGWADYNFAERLTINPVNIDEAKLKGIMSESNYSLKSLEMIATLQALNTQLEATNRKPNIALNGSVGFSENGFQFFGDNPATGQPADFLFSNRLNGSLGAVASYNVYDGGVRKTNVQNAKINQEIAQMDILEASAELSNQLEILITNYNNQLELLELTDQQLILADRNMELTQERFKAGQITSLDFRAVQSQYLNAAFSKVSSIYSLIITKSEIDFLVGKFD